MKTILSIVGFLILIGIAIFGFTSYQDRMKAIDENLMQTMAYIVDKPGYGGVNYIYNVNNKRYSGRIKSQHSNFPCFIGEKFWLEYEKGNPKNHRLLREKGPIGHWNKKKPN